MLLKDSKALNVIDARLSDYSGKFDFILEDYSIYIGLAIDRITAFMSHYLIEASTKRESFVFIMKRTCICSLAIEHAFSEIVQKSEEATPDTAKEEGDQTWV